MINFVAFVFCDNDFHVPLNNTLFNFMADFPTVRPHHLNEEWFKEYAIRGMLGFDSLRSLNHSPIEPYDYARYRAYFDDTLKVIMARTMDEVPSHYEGYVIDLHLWKYSYFGY